MYKVPRNNMQVMNLKRTYVQNLTMGSSAPQYDQIIPSLASLPSYAEFTELYSQYRVNKVKIKWIPSWDMSNGFGTPGANANLLMYATTKNRNGASADFNTENEFLESSDGQWARPITTPRKWYYTPNILTENYKSSTSTGYSFAYKKWLDTTDATIPQYGFAYYLLAFSPQTTPPISGIQLGRWYITLYIQLKGVK